MKFNKISVIVSFLALALTATSFPIDNNNVNDVQNELKRIDDVSIDNDFQQNYEKIDTNIDLNQINNEEDLLSLEKRGGKKKVTHVRVYNLKNNKNKIINDDDEELLEKREH